MRPLVQFCLSFIAALPASAGEMPQGFVYLRDVDPSILQDMRYANSHNFTGHAVPGYDAPECVLVKQAADALKAVQAELREKQPTLKVYDCYRAGEGLRRVGQAPRRSQAEIHLYPRSKSAICFRTMSRSSQAIPAAPQWT
jgi:zinc D-Ala-D-Ala dipeptidase